MASAGTLGLLEIDDVARAQGGKAVSLAAHLLRVESKQWRDGERDVRFAVGFTRDGRAGGFEPSARAQKLISPG